MKTKEHTNKAKPLDQRILKTAHAREMPHTAKQAKVAVQALRDEAGAKKYRKNAAKKK
jgi:hypothetical protein|tara:strand:+ start:471 stop:644 length:174 start_codon:yes stop_codon:yes gene_type:complete